MPTLSELIKLLEQLPVVEDDVFNMMTDYEPKVNYCYLPHTEGKRPNTITISLDKMKYRDFDEASSRATELFSLRKLRPYKNFTTVRYYVWYCLEVRP